MIIWGAMAIPIVVAIVLYAWFRHKTVAWEFIVPFAVSIVCIAGFKYGTEMVQTADTEFWGGWATHAEYFERWDEEVPCTHTKYCDQPSTCTNSDGSTYSCTERVACGTEHLYDVDDHPPRWVLHDSNGESQSISSGQFEGLVSKWHSRVFVDMHRDYHSIDGDKYVATWNTKDDASFVEVTTRHTYENRVQASTSVFNFEEVNPKVWGLYEYPGIGSWDQPAILGNGGSETREADTLLRFWNAKIGRNKQVKMFVLVFGPESTLETGLAQESYWKGGNKNEFILALGTDRSGKVTWTHVISWTEQDRLKIDVREYALNQGTLDLVDLVDYMVPEVRKRFVRKPFADFSYLTVEPPGWAVVLSYFLTLLINLGLSFWIINNRHEEWTSSRSRHYE
ncbi:hypothetical protein COV05_01930 [Candidatus Uhrbacteria bacterium CG10_big_fil_rev_8_21_14_0_10_48_16]|uniref:Uncharacterized protein n=1 Tax=Candidatus Uhrbacteria bacterium CG10_big_fil_rev_8_21_14_0_10_48_16 TaxID=1975038 RepID=A0A2M8LHK6_9BACT|nr:MAG: hypothetical protein COV05_01930 [Candidatus Uhrbacteria bacterium CG10_big_fil_rev_8_21_14_0_10_48_16]